MTKPNKTEIVFLIDRSASMKGIAAEMSAGVDAFIEKQRGVPGECLVTLIQFDDQYEVVYTALPVNLVPHYKLQPRGSTALLDALGKSIDDMGERFRRMAEGERPSQVLFVIITDGEENCSKEYKDDAGRLRVFDKITHQRSKYAWEFIFLGANQDAIATATSLGISATNSVTYAASNAGSAGLMRGLSVSVANYRNSGQSQMDNVYNQAAYDAEVGKPDLSIGFNGDISGKVVVPTVQGVLAGTIVKPLALSPEQWAEAFKNGPVNIGIDTVPAQFPPGTQVSVVTLNPPVVPEDSKS